MSKPVVAGKKHISEKASPSKLSFAFSPRNLLDVSPELDQEIKAKGLEYRWVDAKQYAENGNLHKNHWEIYKRGSDTVSSGVASFGLPSDGSIRRGTLVLAVRKKEVGDAHRAFLKEKAEIQSTAVKRQGAELREMARKGGLSERIIDETEID